MDRAGRFSLARHDFADALQYGRRAAALNPYNGDVYGVIGDAQVELGRYDDAFATFQRMVDTEPEVAAYPRVSYARELQGDIRGAMQAMTAAAERLPDLPPTPAWAAFHVGELRFNDGDVASAAGTIGARKDSIQATCPHVPDSRGSRSPAAT